MESAFDRFLALDINVPEVVFMAAYEAAVDELTNRRTARRDWLRRMSHPKRRIRRCA